MPGETGNIGYVMREPFVRANESLRRSLASRGLKVVGHLDVARRVEKSLGIVLAPCSVLFVLPAPPFSPGAHPWTASFLPLHIVLSANGADTQIQVQTKVCGDLAGAAETAALVEIQARVAEAIGAIAMRPSLLA